MQKQLQLKVVLVALMLGLSFPIYAQYIQTQNDERRLESPKDNYFDRSKGFVVRPEIYSGFFVEFCYQISPSLQVGLGVGKEIDLSGSNPSVTDIVLGVRAYGSAKRWTIFSDYHIALSLVNGYAIPVHRLTIGPSYKNFDCGVGLYYFNFDGTTYISPSITLGYNFRFRKE